MPLLSKSAIEAKLHTKGLTLEVLDSVDSTNRLAKDYGDRGAKEGTVIIADSQTAGRGRLRRSFCSPAGTGLYMSVLLRPSIPAEKVLSVTTAAAVAVCHAIERVSDRTAQIKWVNDVYCGGKKVCGILTEAAFDGDRLGYAVLGVGINVNVPEGGFERDIADIATAVYENGQGDRETLAAAVLDAFFEEYAVLIEEGYVEEYRKRSCLIGTPIVVKSPTGDRDALALGVDEQCHLLVRYEDGREDALSSGDVSVKIVK